MYDPDGTPEVTANCAVGSPTTFYKLYHYYTGRLLLQHVHSRNQVATNTREWYSHAMVCRRYWRRGQEHRLQLLCQHHRHYKQHPLLVEGGHPLGTLHLRSRRGRRARQP